MDGNGNGQPKVELPSTTLVLTITLDQLTGALNVNGPIDNAFISYGMLELAKDAIRMRVAQKQSGQRIVLPSGITAVGSA
jgi:hypothetical protein